MNHEMILTQGTASDGLWECPLCPRKMVLRGAEELIVLDQGDFATRHFGSTGLEGLTLNVEVPKPEPK